MRGLGLALLVLFCGSACHGSSVSVSADLSKTHAISNLLYGVFFEEINHAGEGGLYAELLQDRSFDALAIASGFNSSDKRLQTEANFHHHASHSVNFTVPLEAMRYEYATDQKSKMDLMASANIKRNEQPVAWRPLSSTKVYLTKEDPLTPTNPVALNVTSYNPGGGVINTGYWGISVEKGKKFAFSVFIKGPKDFQISIRLQSRNGSDIYAEAISEDMESYWQQFSANLTSKATDHEAELALVLHKPGSIVIDSLSLFPLENYRHEKDPYPFREDLLGTLKGLRPRFIRFPGGCYVEGGDWLRNRFPWKTNVGPNWNRTGHLNQIWGYWSTDGLGLFEYMWLADELKAEPIYVINNGISHQEAMPPARLKPYIQETMDALEFITGDASTTWGSVRASMGRHKPWNLKFVAIGNEDCWRPYYREDYNAFVEAISAEYPSMILIANCDLGPGSKTTVYDWHSYDSSQAFFDKRTTFDNVQYGKDPSVFVSEYAVTQDGGLGNLRAAVAEAAFMTGMERNSEAVLMAAYAPLFTRQEARSWSPDLIVFDSYRFYLTPSYLVQELFARFVGELYAATEVQSSVPEGSKVAASTSCLDRKCSNIAVKIVNFALKTQRVELSVRGLQERNFGLGNGAVMYTITGAHPEDENSFENPENVKLESDVHELQWIRSSRSGKSKLDLPAMSVTVLALRTDVYHAIVHKV